MEIPSTMFQTYRAASKDKSRYQLNGPCFETHSGTHTGHAVATDGKMLLHSTWPIDAMVETSERVTVASQDAKDVIKLASKNDIPNPMTDLKIQSSDELPEHGKEFPGYTLRPGMNGSVLTGDSCGMFPDYPTILPTTTPKFTWHLNPFVLKSLCEALIKTAGLNRENSTVLFEYHQPDRPMVMSVRNSAGGETQALIMPLVQN